MHRLSWLVVLLLLGTLGNGGGLLWALNTADSRPMAVTFGLGAFVCLAEACVVSTLIAIENKLDGIVSGRGSERAKPVLPPRADGR
jgi:hypothetical protein